MNSPDDLSKRKCVPCQGGALPLPRARAEELLREIPGWRLSEDGNSLGIEYRMKDFMRAVQLIRDIAEISEAEDHHPDIHLTGYRKLRIELSTHSIGGLSENDFILAAKINQLPKQLKPPKG